MEHNRSFRRLARLLVKMERRIMTKLDDLAVAVQALTDSTTAEIAEIALALAAANGGNDPLIQAQIDKLNALKATIDAETLAITPPPGP